MGGFFFIALLVAVALLVLMVVSNIFLFRKMGLPGWYAIIPFWNSWNQFKMTWTTMPWFWLYLVVSILMFAGIDGVLGFVVSVLGLIVGIGANYQLARAFGKGAGYCVGLTLLPIIFLPMLAFGQSQYMGNPAMHP